MAKHGITIIEDLSSLYRGKKKAKMIIFLFLFSFFPGQENLRCKKCIMINTESCTYLYKHPYICVYNHTY